MEQGNSLGPLSGQSTRGSWGATQKGGRGAFGSRGKSQFHRGGGGKAGFQHQYHSEKIFQPSFDGSNFSGT